MNSNKLIVREYLSSLKEDSELDYLFPLLLGLMGFRIVQTAKEAKGQSQYGKDIIAIGKGTDGKDYKWYFELKGYADKDITESNYSKSDGIRESIIEAKDTIFKDSAIPGLNDLPIKVVLVHNGVLKANIRPTFEGFIDREFKNGGFERWDIYYLTELFSQYLFSEYLLSDDRSNILLKKTLAFLDSPDNTYESFKQLLVLQFEKVNDVRSRAFAKLFATLGLLNAMVYHYSKENDYLIPAKECSKFLIIYTWSWVLKYRLDTKKPVINAFNKLLVSHYEIFNEYFKKTFSVAKSNAGLFAENGLFFEKIGYSLRCFDYLDDIVYYCNLRATIVMPKHLAELKNKQKDLLIELIENNSGFYRLILDNHSISIIQLFLFFADVRCRRKKDLQFIYDYIYQVAANLRVEKVRQNIQPELYNNIDLIIEAYATGEKPENYIDDSSVLIAVLLELCVVFNSDDLFISILDFIDKNLSLQIVSLDSDIQDVEQMLFERHLHGEYYVDCIERVKEGSKFLKDEKNFTEFTKSVLDKKESPKAYRTDNAGLSCIRYLAHSYFKNEILPNEWREYIKD